MDSFAQPGSARTPALARSLLVCRPRHALFGPFADLERQQDAAPDDPRDGARQGGKGGEPCGAGNERRISLERSDGTYCTGDCECDRPLPGSPDSARKSGISACLELRHSSSILRSPASLRENRELGGKSCGSAGTPALAQCDRCRRASRAFARSQDRKLWALRNAWSENIAEFRNERAFGRNLHDKLCARSARQGQVALEIVFFLAVAMGITVFFLNCHFKMSRRWEVEVRKPWFTNG